MDRALIFCTAHLQSDPSRYQLWAKYYAKAFKDHNVDLLMVNDGPCNPADKPPEAELIVLEPHLGRHSMNVFPGCKRSFAHALQVAADRDYRWIGHIESDLWLSPEGMKQYLPNLFDGGGFGSGWCRTYQFPETAVLVLNDHRRNRILREKYGTQESWYEDSLFERTIWDLGPGRMFEGDRYEGRIERLRPDDPFIAAVHFSEVESVRTSLAKMFAPPPSPRGPLPADDPKKFCVVLLTTWNRPELLAQSLPQIQEQARTQSWPLVIADDQSTDATTLKLLADAVANGAILIRRDYNRSSGDNPHLMTQLNNLFAFKWIVNRFPGRQCILKVDDDIAMTANAFEAMHRTWKQATEELGGLILELSGIRTTAEPIISQRTGYAITSGACNAAVLYRTADWKTALQSMQFDKVIPHGFDGYMMNEYGRGRLMLSLTPSVVYHAGNHGVHANGQDVNVDYCGTIEGITTS